MLIKGEQTVIEYLAEYMQAQLNNNKFNYEFFVHTSIGEYVDSGRKTAQGTVSNTLNAMLRNLGNGSVSPITSIVSYSDGLYFQVDVRQEDADKVKKILEDFVITNNDVRIQIGLAKLKINALTVADGQALIGSPNGGQITYAFQINISVIQGAKDATDLKYEIKSGSYSYVEIPSDNVIFNMGLTATSATPNSTGIGKQNPAQAIASISCYMAFLDNDVIKQIATDILNRNSKRKYTIKATLDTTAYEYSYYLGGSSVSLNKTDGRILGLQVTFVEAF